MFERVLIVEDHQNTSISVRKTLADFGINRIEYTYYCDDALMLVRKGLDDEQAFDLIITDLYFDEDHRPQQLADGGDLTTAIKHLEPNIKVLVFSAEKKMAIIDALFKQKGINAYVQKGRRDSEELRQALEAIKQGKTYVSNALRQSLRQKNTHEFTSLDITIISLLAQGKLQKDIPGYLEQHHLKQRSLSSVEKRLKAMKESMDFSNNEQLVAYCKDFGLI